MAITPHTAYRALVNHKSDPTHPVLICYAKEKSILNPKEAKFYLDIWNKRGHTPKQKKWMLALNQKMLLLLRRDLIAR